MLLRNHWIPIHPKTAEHRRNEAIFGFHALAEEAKPAVPALLNILASEEDAWVRSSSILALGQLGDAAVVLPFPPMIQHLTNIDPDGWMRTCSAIALGRIHLKPELVVPVLIQNLDDAKRDRQLFEAEVTALGQFKEDAKAAAPVLIHLLDYEGFRNRNHPNRYAKLSKRYPNISSWNFEWEILTTMTNTLKQIDPEALQTARK